MIHCGMVTKCCCGFKSKQKLSVGRSGTEGPTLQSAPLFPASFAARGFANDDAETGDDDLQVPPGRADDETRSRESERHVDWGVGGAQQMPPPPPRPDLPF